METTLLAGSILDASAAILFAYVGWRVTMRTVSTGARVANRALAAWWLSIALAWSIDAARGLAIANGGGATPWLWMHYAYVGLLCIGLWGLLVYLIYVYRGREAAAGVAIFYAAYFVAATVAIAWARPDHVRVGGWATHVVYAQPLPDLVTASFFLLLLAPQLVGVALYLRLAPRVQDAAQRYRVRVVGWTLLAWIGVNLVADVAGLTYDDAWQVARRVIGVAAAALVLLGYAPPAFLRRRWEVAR